MSGWRTQSTVRQTKECGTAASLLVIKHDVWFPDLLCGDTHELHPLVVGGFPFQLVVIPDLVEGGRRQWKDQPGSLSPDTASWSLWGQPPLPPLWVTEPFPCYKLCGPQGATWGQQGRQHGLSLQAAPALGSQPSGLGSATFVNQSVPSLITLARGQPSGLLPRPYIKHLFFTYLELTLQTRGRGRRLRQEGCEFKASLSYIGSSRPSWATNGKRGGCSMNKVLVV